MEHGSSSGSTSGRGTALTATLGSIAVAGHVFVDTGAGTGAMVKSQLGLAATCTLMTPIGASLNALVTYAGLGDTSRSNYVLLVTDGEENCGGNPGDAATALLGRTPEVKTFVIGFGGEVNATQLNDLATKGGTARPGTTKYYQADDAAGLQSAFNSIIGSVVSCSFTLSQQPDSPDRLYIYFGATQVPRDTSHTMGWDYDPTSMALTFYGMSCNSIKDGTAGNLVVSYGCPVIP